MLIGKFPVATDSKASGEDGWRVRGCPSPALMKPSSVASSLLRAKGLCAPSHRVPSNEQYLSRTRPYSHVTCRQFDFGISCVRDASTPRAQKARRPREPRPSCITAIQRSVLPVKITCRDHPRRNPYSFMSRDSWHPFSSHSPAQPYCVLYRY